MIIRYRETFVFAKMRMTCPFDGPFSLHDVVLCDSGKLKLRCVACYPLDSRPVGFEPDEAQWDLLLELADRIKRAHLHHLEEKRNVHMAGLA